MLEDWIRQNIQTIQVSLYCIWVDQEKRFCVFPSTNGPVFFIATHDYQDIKVLTDKQAHNKLRQLTMEVRLRVRRGKPGEENRRYQVESSRLHSLLRQYWGEHLADHDCRIYEEKRYGTSRWTTRSGRKRKRNDWQPKKEKLPT